MSMAMVTLNATSDSIISKTLSFKNSSNLRDASFSSYLDGAEETIVLQLAESNRNFKSHISTSHDHPCLASKKAEDNEIDVFNAAKYFNEGVDDESSEIASKYSPKFHQKQGTPLELYQAKQQTRSAGTPSVHSESSLNSRSSLLHNIPRNQQSQKTNKFNRRSFLGNLRCNCYCIDKNSVDIDDHVGRNSSRRNVSSGLVHGKARKPIKAGDSISMAESQSNLWVREDRNCRKFNDLEVELSSENTLRIPVSNSKNGNNLLEMQRKEEEDSTRRKSLEVFGSPIQRTGKKSLSRQRSINMLTWDAIPRVEEIEIPANSSRLYNDTDSDASSDLFEIESLSTNPSQYLTRQTSDGMSSCLTQTTCYAPSEASIEWSVVTASAADFSGMSDSEGLKSNTTRTETHNWAVNGQDKTSGGKERPKSRSGILSGCYSNKAIRVVGDAYRTNDKATPGIGKHQRSEFLKPMTRFHAESEVARFEKRNGQFISYDTSSLTSSQSGRATHLLHKY